MKIFDLYGVQTQSGEVAINLLANKLGLTFECHESDFWGEYFLAESENFGNFRLIQNYHAGEWQQEDFPEYPWLLEANDVKNIGPLMSILTEVEGVRFLFRSEVEAKKWIRRYVYQNGGFILTNEVLVKAR